MINQGSWGYQNPLTDLWIKNVLVCSVSKLYEYEKLFVIDRDD